MSDFYVSVERYMNSILYVGYENSRRIVRREKFYPTLYAPSVEKAKYKTISGIPVTPTNPGNMKECRQYIEQYSCENYKIYGNTDYVAQFIYDKFPNGCNFDLDIINVGFIDIEVKSDNGFPHPEQAEQPVTAISYYDSASGIFNVFALKDWNKTDSMVAPEVKVRYHKCDDEFRLIDSFLKYFSSNHPDIITGWNIDGFDIPYLVNRTIKLFGEDKTIYFSIHNLKPRAKVDKFDGLSFEIPGLISFDYLKLFKKFTVLTYGNQESYKLDHIANVVLGAKKLDYSEYKSLHNLYEMNHQKYIDYNIIDTKLIVDMDDKLGLINLACTLAHKANSTYESVYGSTKIWDTYIYNILMRNDIIIEPFGASTSDMAIPGGFVKDPIVGMHKWVMSFDLNSLYPHIVMQYNLSPETIVNNIVSGMNVYNCLDEVPFEIPENQCVTAMGQLFSKESQGFFPSIIEELYAERSTIKKKALVKKQELENVTTGSKVKQLEKAIARLDNEQLAVKLLMSSLCGAMANKYFRYFDVRIAEAISSTGQLTIQWAAKRVNLYLNKVLKTDNVDYVLAIDTDSIYVCFDDMINKCNLADASDEKIRSFLNKVAEQSVEPLLEKIYNQLKDYMQAPDQKMVMKREIIAKNAVFTGKKRYIANVLDNEGVVYKEPKLKITGIESVRSSTPEVCRNMIKDTLSVIMNGSEKELQNHVANCKKQFKDFSVEQVSFPRGVNGLDKYRQGDTYAKGCPINVRASILYNKNIKDKDIGNEYDYIREGDKIKFAYLRTPNPIQEDVIGFIDILPEEFGLHSFVDYNKQFEKAYLAPIKTIADAIGWSTKKINTLDSFFS